MVQSWTDRETAVCFQGAKRKAKQLHHDATRSWVCNNDKRIVPWGRKHLHTGDGGFFFFLFFWLMSIRYTIHSDKQEETTRCTERKPKQRQKKNQSHEILMWYIYWQATRTGHPLWGLQGERTCTWLTTTRFKRHTHTPRTHRHRNTLITHTQLWNYNWRRGTTPITPPEDQFWER